MKIIEKYTGEKTYMFPNGTLATKEAVLEQFPAALTFTHIVETDEEGQVMWAFQNLAAMKTIHGIAKETTEADAIAKIQEIINTPPAEPEPSAEERTAAAMELQALNSLADVE